MYRSERQDGYDGRRKGWVSRSDKQSGADSEIAESSRATLDISEKKTAAREASF